MSFIIDMFTLCAANLLYNTDNVIQKNRIKKAIEDFFNCYEGCGKNK